MQQSSVRGYSVKTVATAGEMLLAIDRACAPWTPEGARRCPWVFRGQADSAWPLLPSAWRSTGDEHDIVERVKDSMKAGKLADWLSGQCSNPGQAEWRLQEAAERYLLHEFIRVARRAGLPLPVDAPPKASLSAPAPEAEVTALAQHFGVPTAVLDFTEDPRTAMFWAVAHLKPGTQAVSVWAFDVTMPGVEAVSIEHHDRWRNENLKAQEGVLVYMKLANDHLSAGRPLPTLDACGIPPDRLVRYDLPASEAPALRYRLDAAGYTFARLMPSFHGAALSAKAPPPASITRQDMGKRG